MESYLWIDEIFLHEMILVQAVSKTTRYYLLLVYWVYSFLLFLLLYSPTRLIQTRNGTPFNQRNLLRHIHETLDRASLPSVTFHSLQHFTATALLQKCVHPTLVQSLLGHSSIGLTMDTYSHVMPGV